MQTPVSFTDFVDLEGSDSLELLDNPRIAALTGLTERRVFSSTLTTQRYILKDGKQPLDLAHEVTDRFFERTGLTGRDIGALAVSHTQCEGTTGQDIGESIARRIGLIEENVRVVSFGCTGFPHIVSVAEKQARGIHEDKHVLVLCVETPDRMMDARNKQGTPIFAAGATATSLWNGPGHQLLFSETEDVVPPDNPRGTDIFTIAARETQDFSGRMAQKANFEMNGDLAYTNGQQLIERGARESLERVLELRAGYIGRILVVSHQPNAKMVKFLDEMVAPDILSKYAVRGITDVRFVNGMQGMGNVLSATIPSVIARIDRIQPIERVTPVDPPETERSFCFPQLAFVWLMSGRRCHWDVVPSSGIQMRTSLSILR